MCVCSMGREESYVASGSFIAAWMTFLQGLFKIKLIALMSGQFDKHRRVKKLLPLF